MYRILPVLTLLAGTISVGPDAAAAALPFNDISNSFAKNQIVDLYDKHILEGTADKRFEPDKPISRSEFITVLDRALKIQPLNSAIPAFIDVSPESWCYGWVQAGLDLGVIEGVSENKFEPDKLITREEAAALLVRALKQTADAKSSVSLPFNDAELISSWAVPYVESISKLELMTGDAQGFHPDQPMTRQEMAVVIDKLFTVPHWSGALTPSKSASLIQMGWQYNETTEEFEQNVIKSGINTVSPGWYFLGKDFSFTDLTDTSLVTWAKQNNKKVWALVGNRSDQELTHQLLTQPDKTALVIKQLSTYAQKYQLDGLNIDFENVAPNDRALLTSFIKTLANELHDQHKILTVDVSHDTESEWTAAFDYTALGKSADYIVLMNYDEHWDGDQDPGSVSSLPWFSSGIRKLYSLVPASKIIVALPLYTQDWTLNQGTVTNHELSLWQQNDLLHSKGLHPKWDRETGQYTTNYTLNSQVHAIWLEDSRSLSLKFQEALSDGAAGTAYWYIGGGSTDVWVSLNNMMQYNTYSF